MIQDDVKGREKIIFAAAVVLVIAAALLCAVSSANRREAVDERIARIEQAETAGEPEAGNFPGVPEPLSSLLDTAKILSGRDIFSREPEQATSRGGAGTAASQTPRFEVVDIAQKPLGISYEGRIVFADGRIVAQVNVGRESYLVGTGATVAPYTVADLNRNKLVLTVGSARFVVNYREPAYSDELMATVKELNSAKTFSVSKNSDFLGGTVLDIDEESVLVSKQGQYLRIEKGTVYP